MFMWLQPFHWQDFIAVCSGKGHREIGLGRGICDEVRSETGQKSLFRKRDDGFAFVGSCGRPQGILLGLRGANSRLVIARQNPKMTRSPHSSS
jgi:hypothetical protein